ncbi:MAG: hypothetical protein K0Q63_3903, partial [Paenibacillus sp.]|nr:hypothetical protein [Paenibacillus sp.]
MLMVGLSANVTLHRLRRRADNDFV